jgi:hypothetical protein
MRSIRNLVATRHLLAVVALLAIAAPVSAGLLGSIGNAFGIGGDVGKGLGFIDSVLPGGNTFNDVVGAPGGAVFGKAIKDWKEANNESIQKLGVTNDETVRKLVAGLGKVQNDLTKGLELNITQLTDGLSASIASLDDSLRQNLERLDNSLTSQTARLDTVFQKQTSSLFQIGQILITVFVVIGTFYALSRIISTSGEKLGWVDILKKTKARTAVVITLAVVFVVGTWLWPDPSGAAALTTKFRESYAKSMNYEDYLGASVTASQLAVLAPVDPLIRSYELKSRALRELFFRPTVLLKPDELVEVLRVLAKADQWRMDATKKNDPEVASALALVSFQSFDSNIDLMRAVTLLRNAVKSFGEVGDNADIEPESNGENGSETSISRWRIADARLVQAVSGLSVDPDVIQLGLPNIPTDKIATLQKEFVPQLLTSVAGKNPDETGPVYSPIADLTTSTVNRVEVAKFYRQLLSFYFDHQLAKLRDASQADVTETACKAFRYTVSWHDSTFSRRPPGQLVPALLAGPSTVLYRLKEALGASNPCSALTEASFVRFADARKFWLSTFSAGVTGAGSTNLTRLATAVADKEKVAFDEFEKLSSTVKTDLAIASPDAAQLQNRKSAVMQWLEAATVLGLHAGASSDSSLKPALIWAREQKQQFQDVGPVESQKIAFLYLYTSAF